MPFVNHLIFDFDKAPKSKNAILYTIPAAATRSYKKESELNVTTRTGGNVDADAKKALEEHLTHEQAGWGSAPGYMIKKDGNTNVQKVKKSNASEAGAEEPKKVLEGLIRTR